MLYSNVENVLTKQGLILENAKHPPRHGRAGHGRDESHRLSPKESVFQKLRCRQEQINLKRPFRTRHHPCNSAKPRTAKGGHRRSADTQRIEDCHCGRPHKPGRPGIPSDPSAQSAKRDRQRFHAQSHSMARVRTRQAYRKHCTSKNSKIQIARGRKLGKQNATNQAPDCRPLPRPRSSRDLSRPSRRPSPLPGSRPRVGAPPRGASPLPG